MRAISTSMILLVNFVVRTILLNKGDVRRLALRLGNFGCWSSLSLPYIRPAGACMIWSHLSRATRRVVCYSIHKTSMAIKIQSLLFLGLIISFVSAASAIAGTATYYTVYVRKYLSNPISHFLQLLEVIKFMVDARFI